MLQILWGPRGAGKRRLLLDAVKEGAEQGTRQLILVPETMSHTWERALLEHCGNRAGQTCQVVTFSSLCKKILSAAGGDGGGLDAGGRILAMYRAISLAEPTLEYYRSAGQKPALITGMLQICDEFRSCGISPEQLLQQEIREPKIRDMGLIYSQYRQLCDGLGGTSADRLARAAALAAHCPELQGAQLYLYGFSGFTKLEYELLGALLGLCSAMTVALMLGRDRDLFLEQYRTKGRLERMAADRGISCAAQQLPDRETDSALGHLSAKFLNFKSGAWENTCEDVKLYNIENTDAECDLAAAICRQIAISGELRLRKVAVVCGEMEHYREPLRRAFERYGVPLYVTDQTDLLQKTPVAALLYALQAVRDGYRSETMRSYLKSGLLPMDRKDRDQVENYMTLWKIQGSRWEKPWTGSTEGYDGAGDPVLLAALEQARQRIIEPLSALKNALQQARTGGEMSKALADFLEQLQYEQLVEARMRKLAEDDRRQEAAEYDQIYQYLREAMEQLAVALADLPMDPDQFIYLLRLALSQYKIGSIPVSLDAVHFGNFTRVGTEDLDHLIILGAVEGQFPNLASGGSLLTEGDRILLEGMNIDLTQTDKYRSAEQESMLYRAIAGSKRLTLLRPARGADGEETRNSYVLQFICSCLPQLTAQDGDALLRRLSLTARRPAMALAGCHAGDNPVPGGAAAYEYLCRNNEKGNYFTELKQQGISGRGNLTDPDLIRKIYGEKIYMTASKAERFAACRLAYFIEHGLKVKAVRVAELGATQVGDFLHKIVEESIRKIVEQGLYSTQKQVVSEYVRIYTQWLGGLENMTARERALYDSMEEMAQEVVDDVLVEILYSDFSPVAYEFKLDRAHALELTEGDLTVAIHGAIDRVDAWAMGDKLYVKVVDYKTGKKDFALSDVLDGLNLQMFIYLLMVMEGDPDRIYRAASIRCLEKAEQMLPAAALYIPAKVDYSGGAMSDSIAQRDARSAEALRRIGIVVQNEALLGALETVTEPYSKAVDLLQEQQEETGKKPGEVKYRYLPVSYDLEGYSKRSSLIGEGSMDLLLKRVRRQLLDLGRRLRSGDIQADPYKKGDRTSCDWCRYRPICRFSPDRPGDRMRLIEKKTISEVEQQLEQERRALAEKEAEQRG